MLEKRGVIEQGRTPPEEKPEDEDTKAASVDQLADHATTRLGKAAKDSIGDNRNTE